VPAPEFDHWMVEADALMELRLREPDAALARVHERRGLWTGLTPMQDGLLHARFALQEATALIMLGRQDEAEAAMSELEGLLQSPVLASGEPGLLHQVQRCAVACANARATLAHSMGDFATALRAYQRSLDLARAIGERRFEAHARVNLANAYEESGLPAEALVHLQLALDIALSIGMDELAGDIHHNIGNALAASGHVEQGLTSNRRALASYASLGLAQKEGYALVAIAERLLELGRLGEATQSLQQREGLAGSYVNPQYEAYTAYLRGRIAIGLGDGPGARSAFAQALAVTEGQLGDLVGQARSLLELARLALSEGELAASEQHAQRALTLLQDSHAQRDQMRAHGLLSQIAKAAGDAVRALFHHEAFHAGYERCFNDEAARRTAVLAVRHELDLARADADRQRVENARLSEALAVISARLRSSRSSEDGYALRALPGPVSAEDLQGLGLTLREAQVLLWVTKGKTNEDVTQILGISLSTVKKHLGSIYDKLGVENRTAAANVVRRQYQV
jgi:ATP/maltotriose-dependent transcriptional regulator MalT